MPTALLKTFTITVTKRSALALVAVAAGFAACGATKNTDERRAAAAGGAAGTLNCVRDCKVDPGPGPVDCSAGESGYEYLRLWDFESNTEVGVDDPMYFYNDGSARFLSAPNAPNTMGPAHYSADQAGVLAERCDAPGHPGPTHVLHVQGGPFLSWGGGMGRALSAPPRSVSASTASPARNLDEESEIGNVGLTVDLHEWDGVSFWARIGPESQSGIRVGVGDKFTDDDLSFYNAAKYCARVKICDCNNHKPCTLWQAPLTMQPPTDEYCFDPVIDKEPRFNPLAGDQMTMGIGNVKDNYTPCGATHCSDRYPAFPGTPDPLFDGRACTPYTFQNGVSNSYCFNPGADPNPAEGDQRCGDIPVHTVHLTSDWQLYFVPFSSMIQQGYGKRSPAPLNLVGLSMMKFTWDAGWVDYWLDDVSFYRVKH